VLIRLISIDTIPDLIPNRNMSRPSLKNLLEQFVSDIKLVPINKEFTNQQRNISVFPHAKPLIYCIKTVEQRCSLCVISGKNLLNMQHLEWRKNRIMVKVLMQRSTFMIIENIMGQNIPNVTDCFKWRILSSDAVPAINNIIDVEILKSAIFIEGCFLNYVSRVINPHTLKEFDFEPPYTDNLMLVYLDDFIECKMLCLKSIFPANKLLSPPVGMLRPHEAIQSLIDQ